MQSIIAFTIGVVVISYFALQYLAERRNANEPPIVSSKLPFLGHIIGLVRKKTEYYVELYQSTQLPIYGLNLGGQRVYVVNSPDLIKQVQKQPKVFAFPPIAAHFVKSFCQSSKEANDIVNTNITGEEGDRSYVVSFYKMLTPSLAPGPALDAMNRGMIKNIAKSVQSLADSARSGEKILLSKWLRHEITFATTDAIYGPLNPFKDRKVEEAFWEFNDDLGMLLINFLPAVTASRGHKARKVVADAFWEYFQANGHESGSSLVKNRYQNSIDNNIPLQDIAKFEVGGSLALLLNTTPATFWMMFYIFSHPEILRQCRQELDGTITTSFSPNGTIRRVIDITSIKTHCPLLTSIFAETLRERAMALSVRKIMQDTVLDGKYLLKKDRTLMMPARVLHTDPGLWGKDVKEFNPDRFSKNSAKKYDPAAFRGFGGGTTLCPGRHFATVEILSTVMMFVMRYDLEAIYGWNTPTTNRSSVASGIMEPDTDIEVKVSLRPGFEDGDWAFGLKDSEIIFAVAVEDKV